MFEIEAISAPEDVSADSAVVEDSAAEAVLEDSAAAMRRKPDKPFTICNGRYANTRFFQDDLGDLNAKKTRDILAALQVPFVRLPQWPQRRFYDVEIFRERISEYVVDPRAPAQPRRRRRRKRNA
jgi:hypothetical protein